MHHATHTPVHNKSAMLLLSTGTHHMHSPWLHHLLAFACLGLTMATTTTTTHDDYDYYCYHQCFFTMRTVVPAYQIEVAIEVAFGNKKTQLSSHPCRSGATLAVPSQAHNFQRPSPSYSCCTLGVGGRKNGLCTKKATSKMGAPHKWHQPDVMCNNVTLAQQFVQHNWLRSKSPCIFLPAGRPQIPYV